jgi:hypothetical protein
MECDHIKALDLARKGDWDESHKLVQQYSDKLSCLIHAYLHRVEGDISNASYWYRHAGVDMPNDSLEDEFRCLCKMANE